MSTPLRMKVRRHDNVLAKMDIDLHEMSNRINKITKWSRFKSRRERIIDEYIKVKRKQIMVKQLYAQYVLLKGLQGLGLKVERTKQRHRLQFSRIFICLKLTKCYKFYQARVADCYWTK